MSGYRNLFTLAGGLLAFVFIGYLAFGWVGALIFLSLSCLAIIPISASMLSSILSREEEAAERRQA